MLDVEGRAGGGRVARAGSRSRWSVQPARWPRPGGTRCHLKPS